MVASCVKTAAVVGGCWVQLVCSCHIKNVVINVVIILPTLYNHRLLEMPGLVTGYPGTPYLTLLAIRHTIQTNSGYGEWYCEWYSERH